MHTHVFTYFFKILMHHSLFRGAEKVYFFRQRGKNDVVFGCFGMLPYSFGCGHARCVFVLNVFAFCLLLFVFCLVSVCFYVLVLIFVLLLLDIAFCLFAFFCLLLLPPVTS